MSSTQINPQQSAQDNFTSGLWRLWPFSLMARGLRSIQVSQQSFESQLLQLQQQQQLLVEQEAAVAAAQKKIELVVLQQQQNNVIEIDRLEQEIAYLVENKIIPLEMGLKTLQQHSTDMFVKTESAVSRIDDAISLLQKPPNGSSSVDNLLTSGKSDATRTEATANGLLNAQLVERALSAVQKDIVALQIQASAQSWRLGALASLAAEAVKKAVPKTADGLPPIRDTIDEFKRLSAREKAIAQQLKQLSEAVSQNQ
jgi:hypothetical protein